MNSIVNRIISAFRIIFVDRVVMIEVKFCQKRNQDRVTMWGTIHRTEDTIIVLRQLADSLESELSTSKVEELKDLSAQKN